MAFVNGYGRLGQHSLTHLGFTGRYSLGTTRSMSTNSKVSSIFIWFLGVVRFIFLFIEVNSLIIGWVVKVAFRTTKPIEERQTSRHKGMRHSIHKKNDLIFYILTALD